MQISSLQCAICVFLQDSFTNIWGKFLSHLHNEIVCVLRVFPGQPFRAYIRFIIHTVYTWYTFIHSSHCVFVLDTNAVSSLFVSLKEIADFSWKSFTGCHLPLIKYSLISFICWMCYVHFPFVAFCSQPRWSLLFRSMHTDLCCF